MRVIGGSLKGRAITAPQTKETRPTMDRTREAVFNRLNNAPFARRNDGISLLRGAHVLDVFAGSGAYGIEALSNGATHATFIDYNRAAIDCIQQNVYKMGVAQKSAIIQTDIQKISRSSNAVADIAFFDPPYARGFMNNSIQLLVKNGWIDSRTLLVVEMAAKHADPMDGIDIIDARTYGRAAITFAKLINS